MKCYYPQKRDIKNRGTEFTIEHRCGQCIACRITRREEWACRILLESKLHTESIFCTLTYDEEHYPQDGSLEKKEAQDFIKRLRFHYNKKYGKKLRYFITGEYGDRTERAHYHAVIFGMTLEEAEKCIEISWKKGYTKFSELNPTRARYVARYTTKKLTSDKSRSDGRVNEFALQSRKPGIGQGMMPRIATSILRHGYYSDGGLSSGDQKRMIEDMYRWDGYHHPSNKCPNFLKLNLLL